MIGSYILDGRVPVRCEDLHQWVRNLETANRRVAKTVVSEDVMVSTMFLGVDHSFDDGPPVLFETMVFRDGVGVECERYSTWEEAEAGHTRMVETVSGEP